jgi:hypothetical protein
MTAIVFLLTLLSAVQGARGDGSPSSTASDAGDAAAPALSSAPAAPRDVGPMLARAATDGHWAPVAVDQDAGAPLLFKMVLHPDAARPAELFVVAVELARVRLASVAGAPDPEAEIAAAKSYVRTAVIPAAHHAALLGAFNGGWKADHGHFGMKVDGVTLTAPRDSSCTVAGYDDDTLRIAPWPDVVATEPRMRFFRQTPACLFTRGVRHPGLTAEQTTNWGAAADASPIIRRSAIGLDEHGKTLFIGVSNAMTAPALANGMRHAGAYDIAELDVNWSFPKFLVFRTNAAGVLEAETLFPGFVFDKAEYVRKKSPRDFFYLVRR